MHSSAKRILPAILAGLVLITLSACQSPTGNDLKLLEQGNVPDDIDDARSSGEPACAVNQGDCKAQPTPAPTRKPVPHVLTGAEASSPTPTPAISPQVTNTGLTVLPSEAEASDQPKELEVSVMPPTSVRTVTRTDADLNRIGSSRARSGGSKLAGNACEQCGSTLWCAKWRYSSGMTRYHAVVTWSGSCGSGGEVRNCTRGSIYESWTCTDRVHGDMPCPGEYCKG